MRAIVHGTWMAGPELGEGQLFFVWAERVAQTRVQPPRARVARHPFAATTIEIADFLEQRLPGRDWRGSRRMTAVALLPSSSVAPLVPGWLLTEDAQEAAIGGLRPWRIEGLGISARDLIELLVSLPVSRDDEAADHRLGDDLRYWGLAAKFVLELLARQRYLPGIELNNGASRAAWFANLDDEQDATRFEQLVLGMPPACRAVVPERELDRDHQHTGAAPRYLLESFVNELLDRAVRSWGVLAAGRETRVSRPASGSGELTRNWWRSLLGPTGELRVSQRHHGELNRFYQAWKSWTTRTATQEGASFRICFRLEPPNPEAGMQHWRLAYFLQATDDPSLLVPSWEVWRERGDALSYLNRRFDNPQEKLLEGLGVAADLCPAIKRSLRDEAPESTLLTDQEAFSFLREIARLLEGSGFGVLVPPWWNQQDTRLRVRARLGGIADTESSGMLSMDSLVTYDWQLALGDEVLTREEFERLAALKAPLVQVRGRWVLLQPDQVEAAVAFWQKHRQREQLRLGQALNLALGATDELDGLTISEIDVDDDFSRVLDALTQRQELALHQAPEGFVGELRPYQRVGFSWLAFLRQHGFGACLADDMGLGKTIQAIALLLHLKEAGLDGNPSLVVCPTSLVGNWRREINRFAPHLQVMVHHGTGRAEGDAFLKQSLANDVVISTYGLVRRDLDDLTQVHWDNVILDEAQNIKNPLTKQARAVRRLRARGRVALTGTPIENRLTELWSIFGFLNPGYLGTHAGFRRTFVLPIERYQDQEAVERLRRLVRPFVLRRVKTDPHVIADLPDKFEHKVYCNLTREQVTLYEAVVQDAMAALHEDRAEEPAIRRRGIVLAMLTRLKQICDHPALFLKDGSSLGRRAGKHTRLCEMLEEILELDERALIFSQFAEMGKLLQEDLERRFDRQVFFLHGGTPQQQRERMIRAFQEDPHAPSIFVLSLKAGGTGLNLMRANHVFHYDRWWNPAVENQATDRAYRIGQSRDVQVHKFISLGTLEERIDALIESKSELAENVIGDDSAWITELSTDDLRALVELREEALESEDET
ncbi:MAG: SNF2-related protein [Anaerolineae bacterium]|jgi:SNF2 family DNA or RNA helicase